MQARVSTPEHVQRVTSHTGLKHTHCRESMPAPASCRAAPAGPLCSHPSRLARSPPYLSATQQQHQLLEGIQLPEDTKVTHSTQTKALLRTPLIYLYTGPYKYIHLDMLVGQRQCRGHAAQGSDHVDVFQLRPAAGIKVQGSAHSRSHQAAVNDDTLTSTAAGHGSRTRQLRHTPAARRDAPRSHHCSVWLLWSLPAAPGHGGAARRSRWPWGRAGMPSTRGWPALCSMASRSRGGKSPLQAFSRVSGELCILLPAATNSSSVGSREQQAPSQGGAAWAQLLAASPRTQQPPKQHQRHEEDAQG